MADRQTQFHRLYRELRINKQRQYYEHRCAEYRSAHRQAIVVRNVLLLAASLTGLAGQITSGTGRAAVGVAAALLAALAGAVIAFEALIGFPRLGKLYHDARINLTEAGIDWDDLDPHGDVAAGMERVEQIFRKENGQWGQLVVRAGATAAGKPVTEEAPGTK